MMTEISLNILDVTENSVKAGATCIEITVAADTEKNRLTVIIADNGCGMSPEQLLHVTDPFYTTRTTRKVGLGIPFFKAAAEQTGGSFTVTSTEGVGTTVTAEFILSSVDRMPLGDISATVQTLVTVHLQQDFLYRYCVNEKSFTLDTKEFKKILGDIPLNAPEVRTYLGEFLKENTAEVNGEILL